MNILAITATLGSAQKIAKNITELTGEDSVVFTDPNKAKDIQIRYGNTGGNWETINRVEFINIIRDKLAFSAIMAGNKIPSPIYYTKTENIIFPCLIRTSLTTTGGRGIFPVENEIDFNNIWKKGYCWTPYITTEYELRVHVLGGKICRIFKKEWVGADEEPKFVNRHNDLYHYSLKNNDSFKKLSLLVEQLNNIFGASCFYGMDVGWDSQRKQYFIFELNSAPGVNNNTARIYAEFFVNLLQERPE